MSLKESFVARVSPVLTQLGFEKEKKELIFSRSGDRITAAVALDFSKYGQQFVLNIRIAIRSEEIAKLRAAFDPETFKGKYYFTVATDMHELAGRYDQPVYKIMHYNLQSENDIDPSVTHFNSFMSDLALPFISRFKTVADFDEWFNDALRKGTYDFELSDVSGDATEGLIAAKLSRPSELDQLYQQWADGLRKVVNHPSVLDELKSLKGFLDRQ